MICLTIWLDLCEISDTEKFHFWHIFPTFRPNNPWKPSYFRGLGGSGSLQDGFYGFWRPRNRIFTPRIMIFWPYGSIYVRFLILKNLTFWPVFTSFWPKNPGKPPHFRSLDGPELLQDGFYGFWWPQNPMLTPRIMMFWPYGWIYVRYLILKNPTFWHIFPTFDPIIVENLHIFGVWRVHDPS